MQKRFHKDQSLITNFPLEYLDLIDQKFSPLLLLRKKENWDRREMNLISLGRGRDTSGLVC